MGASLSCFLCMRCKLLVVERCEMRALLTVHTGTRMSLVCQLRFCYRQCRLAAAGVEMVQAPSNYIIRSRMLNTTRRPDDNQTRKKRICSPPELIG